MPSEVEAVLFSHPDVQDCIVWRQFDETKGHVLAVGLVLTDAKDSEVRHWSHGI